MKAIRRRVTARIRPAASTAASRRCPARSRSRWKRTTTDRDRAIPGASTGAGGEIRDEGATGRGSKPKAGLTGFSVSHLRIPELPQPWEAPRALNPRMAPALEIMTDGPLGGAAFNNEFSAEPARLLP